MDNFTTFYVSITILAGIALLLLYINHKLSGLYKLLKINSVKDDEDE